MSDLEVKFFPAQQVNNGHLGGGYIRSGVCSVRFTAWVNPKFSLGFSLRLPSRQVNGEYKDEVSFLNREASDAVYNAIASQVTPLLGAAGRGNSNASAPMPPGNTGFVNPAAIQSTPAAGAGVPRTPF